MAYSLRVLVALTAASTLLIGTAPAVAASPSSGTPTKVHTHLTMGISDNGPYACDPAALHGQQGKINTKAAGASFTAQFNELGVHTVRAIVPWDVADPSLNPNPTAQKVLEDFRTCFDAWLTAVAADTTNKPSVEVDFNPDYNFVSRGKIRVPTIPQYRTAVTHFRDSYVAKGREPAFVAIGAWNEPDFASDHKIGMAGLPDKYYTDKGALFSSVKCKSQTEEKCGPLLAAHMWMIDHQVFHGTGVDVIAGDFDASGGLGGYVQLYAKHLHTFKVMPHLWALHPYRDIENAENAYVQHKKAPAASATTGYKLSAYLKHAGYPPSTTIWLNEISVFYHWYLSAPSANKRPPHPNWDQHRQALAAQYLLQTMEQTPRGAPSISRFYYLRFASTQRWRALVVNGKPVPAYTTFDTRIPKT